MTKLKEVLRSDGWWLAVELEPGRLRFIKWIRRAGDCGRPGGG